MSNRTLIPAFEAHVGDWKYYMCIMKYAEVAKIYFAYELGSGNRDFNNLIQRGLAPRTADIEKYLLTTDSRFLGAMVVAAWGGDPEFTRLRMEDPEGVVQGIDQGFGLLTFDGSQSFFALDGQHRLKAIKDALKRDPSLGNDEISVLIVPHLDTDKGRERTRRLFTNINRNAKQTTQAENIALDVDDGYALTTRRLLEEDPFLSEEGVVRIFSSKGSEGDFKLAASNIAKTDKHAWTTLTVLYDLVKSLGFELSKEMSDQSIRPSDEALDEAYEKLSNRLSELRKACGDMHDRYLKVGAQELRVPKADAGKGHPLMRPAVQKAVASAARTVIDQERATWKEVLTRLGKLDWRLDKAPFNTVWTADKDKMQSGKDFTHLLRELLIVHIAPMSRAQVKRARQEYRALVKKQYPFSEDELSKAVA
jgi:DNA sulfur modification protein DndB